MRSINILDPEGRNTVMYSIEDTRRTDSSVNEKYLSRLPFKSTKASSGVNKAFILEDDKDKEILVLSFMPEKVFINLGIIEKGNFKMATASTRVEYINTDKGHTTEFNYTPTRQRKIFIIDIETAEELKPQLLMSDDGTIKGRVLLDQDKKYLAIELRKDGYRKIAAAFVSFREEENKYTLNIEKEEAKLILLDKYREIIDLGKCVDVPLKEIKLQNKTHDRER